MCNKFAFICLSGFYILETLSCAESAKPVAKAAIIKYNGKVSVNDKVIGKKVTLKNGDMLETDENEGSFADIRFEGGNYVRLRKGKITIQEVNSSLMLNRGKAFISIKKLPKDDFKIETEIAVSAVRGTSFFVEESPDKTYFCVCEGTITVFNKEFQSMTKDVHKGYDLWVTKGKEPENPKESPDMFKMIIKEFSDMGFKIK